MSPRLILSTLALALLLSNVAAAWPDTSFVTPAQLVEMRQQHDDLVVIDARKPADYANGHIPGAINLPPNAWRTPSVKAGQGDSQYIFRREDGSVDIERYEKMLGAAGITRQTPVVIYGQHAGKTDGSVPAMILDMLGHEKVFFLDGIGAKEWEEAGYELTTEPTPAREPATYEAQFKQGVVWNLDDVLSHLGDEQVIFYDTRSKQEYHGENLRDNARGGRIPGAVLYDYAYMLKSDKTCVAPEQALKGLQSRGITPDKTIVLYCQTATRVSLPYLMLRDLGYENVKVYDASWHEYGNRKDTPIETDEGVVTAAE